MYKNIDEIISSGKLIYTVWPRKLSYKWKLKKNDEKQF